MGLADILLARASELSGLSAVSGFDGFIDEMIQVVGERQGVGSFTPMPGIGDFATWVGAAAGRSALREIIVRRQDPGGCALNLADGLATLGVGVDLFATLGTPVHPAFAPILKGLRSATPVGSVYGRTLALEFDDGKLMLSAVAQLAEFDAGLARRLLLAGAFPAACARAQLIALTNWTLYPHMTEVWSLLEESVFAKLAHRPAFILDLVDPTSRTPEDIQSMLAVLPRLARHGHVALGLNLNEGNILARQRGIAAGCDQPEPLIRLAADLTRSIGVTEVVIHALHHAATPLAAVPGPYCARPRKLTGAGDRFHAGYGIGLMLGLPDDQRLRLGNAASGFFVRRAASATLPEFIAFCRSWDDGAISTFG